MAKGEGIVKSDESQPDLDQYAKEALDEIFGKEEQSYEDFVQSFMYLNKDDNSGTKVPSPQGNPHDLQNGASSHNKLAKLTVDDHHSLETKIQGTESDNIPEEVLRPGSTSVPFLMRTPESSGAKILQVDNFVEYADEGSDDERSIPNVDSLLEDDIFASGYSPSVVNSSNSSKHKGDRISTAKDIPSNVDLGIELCHEATKEVCYLPGDASILPGEVDDYEMNEQPDNTSEAVVSPKITQLQIATRINNCHRKNDQRTPSEEGEDADEVQPFTLDTNFDYDNVILTPKFSFSPRHIP